MNQPEQIANPPNSSSSLEMEKLRLRKELVDTMIKAANTALSIHDNPVAESLVQNAQQEIELLQNQLSG